MDEPISRRGQWWTKNAAGNWLRWNEQQQTWEAQSNPPPPPGPEDATTAPAQPNQMASGKTALLLVAVAIAFALVAVFERLVELIGIGNPFVKGLAAAPIVLVEKIQTILARAIRKPALGVGPQLRPKASEPRRVPWHYTGVLAGAVLIAASQLTSFFSGFLVTLFGGTFDSGLVVVISIALLVQIVVSFLAGRWIRKSADRWFAAVVVFGISSRLFGILTDYLLTPASMFKDFYGIEKNLDAILASLMNPFLWMFGLFLVGIAIGGAWSARNWSSSSRASGVAAREIVLPETGSAVVTVPSVAEELVDPR